MAVLAVIGILATSCGGDVTRTTNDNAGNDNAASRSEERTPSPSPSPTRTPSPTPPPAPPPPEPGSGKPGEPGVPPQDPEAEQPTIQISEAEFVGSGERKLRVHYTLPSPCSYSLGDTEVDDRSDAVVVTLHRKPPADQGGICAQVIVNESTPVTLSSPLGNRPLVDGGTGNVIKVH